MDLKNNNLKPRAPIPAHSVPLIEGVDRKYEWCMWDLQIFCNIMYSYQMYINKTYNRIFREEYDDRFRVIFRSVSYFPWTLIMDIWLIYFMFVFIYLFVPFISPKVFKRLNRFCRNFYIVKSMYNHLLSPFSKKYSSVNIYHSTILAH